MIKKHALEAANVRSKRHIQPPSRLRNEFILDEGKRPHPGVGKITQTKKVENFKKSLNTGDKLEIRVPKQVSHRSVGHGKVTSLPLSAPSSQVFRSAAHRKPSDFNLKPNKPVISARYLYNHSLLRRMHKCGPCFVPLSRLKNCAPTQRVR